LADNSADGEIQTNTGAVIVATGGFGNNPEMINKYTNFKYGVDLFSMRIPGMVGEGIRMAWRWVPPRAI